MGYLQATIELKDAIFDSMTFEDWTTSIKSKAHRFHNLHLFLPQDITFFILLSSIAGIAGYAGQANYAAGNTYQNALAQHRRTIRLKATSIDLGWMADVGIVAENERMSKNKEAPTDLTTIREKEFLALLKVYGDPELNNGPKGVKFQPITGLVTPTQIRAEGMKPPAWTQLPTLARTNTMGANGLGSSDGSAAVKIDSITQFVRKESDNEAAAVVASNLLQRLSGTLFVALEVIDIRCVILRSCKE